MADAIKDGNKIHAVIQGSSVNQDGASDSFTAPSQTAQENNLVRAYRDAGIELKDVDYIEAHGTGTRLGDAVELNAIANVIGKSRTQKEKPLYIGSVKTNIGHLEPAAGIAGLIKVILSLEKGKLPANLNFSEPNPGIDWERSNVTVPTKNMAWNEDKDVVAGINAFGFSGTNAHIVVKSHQNSEETLSEFEFEEISSKEDDKILCLSAKSPKSLNDLIDQYVAFLRLNPNVNLADVCQSALQGRSHYKYRIATSAKSNGEIVEKLLENREKAFNSVLKAKNVSKRGVLICFGKGYASSEEELLKALKKTNRIFEDTFNDCISSIEDTYGLVISLDATVVGQDSFSCHLVLFAFKFSLIKLLGSAGLNIEAVLDGGVSSLYALACYRNECSFEEALKEYERVDKGDQLRETTMVYEIENDVEQESGNNIDNLSGFIRSKSFANGGELEAWLKSRDEEKSLLVDVLSSVLEEEVDFDSTNNTDLLYLRDQKSMVKFMTEIYHFGANLESFFPEHSLNELVDVPSYQFERKEYWPKSIAESGLSPSKFSIGSIPALPELKDLSLDNGRLNMNKIEQVFSGQIMSMTDQISEAVQQQLNLLKSKWIKDHQNTSASVEVSIDFWEPIQSENEEEWRILLVDSNVPLEDVSLVELLQEKIENDNMRVPDSPGAGSDSSHRMAALCTDIQDISRVFSKNLKRQILKPKRSFNDAFECAFMFTGLGEQYEKMGQGLYNSISSFREDMDYCFEYIESNFGFDLKEVMFNDDEVEEKVSGGFDLREMLGCGTSCSNVGDVPINRILYAHTSILIIQYSLGRLLMRYGLKPSMLIGHSLGEYSAACFSGVLTIEQAMYLIVNRARIIEDFVPEGRMLAVSISSNNMKEILAESEMEGSISLSLVNSPQSIVVSGAIDECERLGKILEEKEIMHRQLRSVRGFHSHMLDPVKTKLLELFSNVEFKSSSIPYVSNVNAQWITSEQCTNPSYWVDHTCKTVLFEQGMETLLVNSITHLFEVGPGNSLCSFVAQNGMTSGNSSLSFSPSLSGVYSSEDDDFFFKKLLAKTWVEGGKVFTPEAMYSIE